MTVHGTAVGTRHRMKPAATNSSAAAAPSPIPPRCTGKPLTDSEGSVLDPIVAIRNTVVIEPDETVRVNLVTGVAETAKPRSALIEKYHDRHLADRVFELAWTHSQVVLRQLDATEADAQLYGRLASSILYANPLLRAPPQRHRPQPPRTIRAVGLRHLRRSADRAAAHRRSATNQSRSPAGRAPTPTGASRAGRRSGDLERRPVRLSPGAAGSDHRRHRLAREASLLDKPGGIFVRRVEQMSEEDKMLMQTRRPRHHQRHRRHAGRADRSPRRADGDRPAIHARRGRGKPKSPSASKSSSAIWPPSTASAASPSDGREYVITTTADHPTPAPWVNVLANPWFGTVVTESGGAYTWCENAKSSASRPGTTTGRRRQRRSVLHPRRRDRPILVAHAAAGPRADALHHPPRIRIHHLRIHRRRHQHRK